MREHSRFGATLIELMLCIIVLGIIGAMVVPMVRARAAPPVDSPQLRIAAARRAALERGTPTTIDWGNDSALVAPVTVWRDGHVTSDSMRGIESITGLTDTASLRRSR